MLKNPESKSPSHPPKYTLYCDKDGKDVILGYTQCYAATRVIDLILDDEGYDYVDNDKDILVTDSGVTIRSTRLKEVMEHELSREEDDWEPHKDVLQNIQYLQYGEASDKTNHQINKKNTQKTKIPKHAIDSFKGVPDIARELHLTGSKTRQLLRKIMDKPSHGWKFPAKDFDNVVKQLQEIR